MILTLAELATYIASGDWRGSLLEFPTTLPLGGLRTSENGHRETLRNEIASKISQFSALSQGRRVLIKTDQSVDAFLSLIAIWHYGAVAIPLDPNASDEQVGRIAELTAASYILVPKSDKPLSLRTSVPEENLQSKPPARVAGSDLALIIPTSGSTGNSKCVMLTHLNVVFSVYAISKYLNLRSTDRILVSLPLTFDYGLYQLLFATIINCTAILHTGSRTPYHVLAAARTTEATVLPLVPSMAAGLIRVLRDRPDLKPERLRTITNTGGHLPYEIIRRLRSTFRDTKIFAMYGLTECKRALYLPPEDIERKPNSVGIPIPGVDARVFSLKVDTGATTAPNQADRTEAAPEEVGELCVRGPNVMQGYIGSETQPFINTGLAYRDDIWLATGDLFYRDFEGYFYFVGRIKDLIKQNGFNIGSAHLESEITALDEAIEAVCVFPDRDKDQVEVAHAYIKLRGDDVSVKSRVFAKISKRLDGRYRPSKITFVPDLPLTLNGKYDRTRLFLLPVRNSQTFGVNSKPL